MKLGFGEFEIGRILHFKSEIRNFKLDRSNLKSRLSDLKCRIRPISNFSSAHPHTMPMLEFEWRFSGCLRVRGKDRVLLKSHVCFTTFNELFSARASGHRALERSSL